MRRSCFFVAMFSVLALATASAQAQDAGLHFHQAGAHLDFADAELRLLHGALTAKEFDAAFAKATSAELERALGSAKRSIDRATSHLPEASAKMEPEMVKLRDLVKAAEDQLRKLNNDIEEQTKAGSEEEESSELGEISTAASDEEARRDWELLKHGAGWLAVDIGVAKSAFSQLGKKLRFAPPRAPARPKGKREE